MKKNKRITKPEFINLKKKGIIKKEISWKEWSKIYDGKLYGF